MILGLGSEIALLLFQVRVLHGEKKFEVIADKDLKGCYERSELEEAVELALRCTQSNPNLRPKMSEALRVLEGLAGPPEEPQGGPAPEPRAHSDGNSRESSFVIEAMELSGPR